MAVAIIGGSCVTVDLVITPHHVADELYDHYEMSIFVLFRVYIYVISVLKQIGEPHNAGSTKDTNDTIDQGTDACSIIIKKTESTWLIDCTKA